MPTPFEQYVTEQHLDAYRISQASGIRYLTVYNALKGQSIRPETTEKIRAAVLQLTGVPYTGPFVLFPVAPPVTPQRR